MAKKPKLKLVDRLEIKILLEKGYSLRAISRSMERGHNTIAYEVEINGGRKRYNPQLANQRARTRRKNTRKSWSGGYPFLQTLFLNLRSARLMVSMIVA